jgi:hypothetical protein
MQANTFFPEAPAGTGQDAIMQECIGWVPYRQIWPYCFFLVMKLRRKKAIVHMMCLLYTVFVSIKHEGFKRARERSLITNTRARVVFADGSIKVLETFCGHNLLTKSDDKNADKRLNMYLVEERGQ